MNDRKRFLVQACAACCVAWSIALAACDESPHQAREAHATAATVEIAARDFALRSANGGIAAIFELVAGGVSCGANATGRRFEATVGVHRVSVSECMATEEREQQRWETHRFAINGLAPDLSLSVRVPALLANGLGRAVTVNGATLSLIRGDEFAYVELARDEATEIAFCLDPANDRK